MKYLEHRSQAERLALAEALEATFGEGGRYRRLHQHIGSRGRRRIRISCHDRAAHSGCYDRPDAW